RTRTPAPPAPPPPVCTSGGTNQARPTAVLPAIAAALPARALSRTTTADSPAHKRTPSPPTSRGSQSQARPSRPLAQTAPKTTPTAVIDRLAQARPLAGRRNAAMPLRPSPRYAPSATTQTASAPAASQARGPQGTVGMSLAQ